MAGKLWIVRGTLLVVLAGLLAWRIADLTGDEAAVARSGFDRAAWEAEYAAYLDEGLKANPALVPCALNELEEYTDAELEHELTHGRRLFLSHVRVTCDRLGAEAMASNTIDYALSGREVNCMYRTHAGMTDAQLARTISSQRRIDRLTRSCDRG